MSIKEQLLKNKNKVHSIDVKGTDYYYKHLKAGDQAHLSGITQSNLFAVVFALCACEKDGELMFGIDEVDLVAELPNELILTVGHAALRADEKKQ